MANKPAIGKLRCVECGAKFDTNLELGQHFHAVLTVSPRSAYLILLPDGCTPGRFEAAQAFAEAIVELKQKCPRKEFQLIPFGHSKGALNSILAVVV
ncbi:MAG: hypothetical protein HYW88_00490 [Candidatus Sungbacteria bacterium]|nr:hypothetical protein [Candidatus Sungbacteria bacterium]